MVGGHVDEELLRNEYLVAENEIFKSKIEDTIKFNDEERTRLARIGKRLGLKALQDIACIVKPETILKWFRDLIAKKFDGSKNRDYKKGRPKIDEEIVDLIIQFAIENPTWGYDRIAGALANLGHKVCDQTVGNVLEKNGIPSAPKRNT